jgi:hypothetical protein
MAADVPFFARQAVDLNEEMNTGSLKGWPFFRRKWSRFSRIRSSNNRLAEFNRLPSKRSR